MRLNIYINKQHNYVDMPQLHINIFYIYYHVDIIAF